MRLRLFSFLEFLFTHIETAAARAREAVSLCPHCGRNRYTGGTCQ